MKDRKKATSHTHPPKSINRNTSAIESDSTSLNHLHVFFFLASKFDQIFDIFFDFDIFIYSIPFERENEEKKERI